jgi:hypothetical protein
MTEQTLVTLLDRIERLSAANARLSQTVTHLRADRELLKRWNHNKVSELAGTKLKP